MTTHQVACATQQRIKAIARNMGVELSEAEIRLNSAEGLVTLISERMTEQTKAKLFESIREAMEINGTEEV